MLIIWSPKGFFDDMHELPVTRNIIEIAIEKAAQAKAQKISRIDVVIGEISGVETDCVSFYFDILKKDYDMAGTSLIFHTEAASLQCRQCNREFSSKGIPWACPECNSLNVAIKKRHGMLRGKYRG